MSESEERRAAAVAAWEHRDFRFYSAARLVGILGAEAQAVGVAWQIYQITHSALALGYTGLALFLPGLLFTLPVVCVFLLIPQRAARQFVPFLALAIAGVDFLSVRAFLDHWFPSPYSKGVPIGGVPWTGSLLMPAISAVCLSRDGSARPGN